MSRRFYWIKLPSNFFHQHDVEIIEAMPKGKEYLLFYIKLLAESSVHDGCLRFSEQIPYTNGMLSVVLRTDLDIVNEAMNVFASLHLVEFTEDNTIYLPELMDMVGSETDAAIKKRTYRGQLKDNVSLKEDNVQTMSKKRGQCPREIEKELDIELEIEKDKKNVRHKYGAYKNVLLTDEDMDKLKNEFPSDYEQRIERLSEYIASSGKSYKNHLATIRNWARRDAEKNPKKDASFDVSIAEQKAKKEVNFGTMKRKR